MTPAINGNPGQSVVIGVNDTGDKFIAAVVDTGEQLIVSVVDTGDKHKVVNMPAIFLKIQTCRHSGTQEIDSWKKLEAENPIPDSP